jgi:SAM-dependent methyltransferase
VGALSTSTGLACPVCRHKASREIFRSGGYTFRRCSSCALRFAWPRPTAEDLAAVYAESYFDEKGWVGDPTSDSSYMTRCWADVAPSLDRRFPQRGKLLDVGCATGAFIAAAATDGWSVSGLEYSADAAERARAAGLDVRAGALSDGAFDGDTFDAITAWHVVEHLVDPIADLRLMRSLSRPGGVLIVETPNARSIGAILKRERWAQVRPPEHINFFDAKALERALGEAGWRLESARTIYKRDTAERIAGRAWLAPAARAAARMFEEAGMGGNLRAMAVAV